MSKLIEVAIVGAGPYGLSLAAHLRAHGVAYRIFGKPMEFWRSHMPKGMHLKSDGFASDLYDPKGVYTLQRFCTDRKLEYSDRNYPIPLDTFSEYGCAFQQQLVPDLEQRMVRSVAKSNGNFTLQLDNHESVTAKRVVSAVGCMHFQRLPSSLAHLPSELLTHSSHHHELEQFKNQTVAVIGAGSSAIDLAALLNEAGANVQLVARASSLYIHDKGDDTQPLLQQIRRPLSGIGPGWRAYMFHHAPWLFHHLPEDVRLRLVRNTLGPAGGWFMKDRIMGRVPLKLGYHVEGAAVRGRSVHLDLRAPDGARHELTADHVIAATGYKVDVARLDFLNSEIRSKIATVEGTPVLSRNLESSIPGLHFIGIAAANSFGPVMRFACGAGFTARKLTNCVRQVPRRP